LGATSDIASFFWAEGLVALAMVMLMANYMVTTKVKKDRDNTLQNLDPVML
jgi:hypothetical protein